MFAAEASVGAPSACCIMRVCSAGTVAKPAKPSSTIVTIEPICE